MVSRTVTYGVISRDTLSVPLRNANTCRNIGTTAEAPACRWTSVLITLYLRLRRWWST